MIRPLPPAPSRDNPGPFASQSDALLAALDGFVEDSNRLEQSLIFVGTTGQSATPLAVGDGTKTLTASTGKAWVIGAWLHLVSAGGIGNVMVGQVQAYDVDTGALQVNIGAFAGSGTHSDWLIGLSSPQAPITAALIASGAIAARVAADGGLMLPGNAANALGAVPKQQLEAAIAAVVVYQPGQRVELFRATIPAGARLLKANGAAVPVSSYADMTAAIYCGDANNATSDWGYRTTSSTSPSTNRSTTGAFIVLPDGRGRFGRGWADDGSLDSGRNLWRYQDHALQDHYHLSSGANNANGVGPGSGVMGGGGQTATTGAIGANVAGETRPVNAAALVCIAY